MQICDCIKGFSVVNYRMRFFEFVNVNAIYYH